jgi:hypothetical protein
VEVGRRCSRGRGASACPGPSVCRRGACRCVGRIVPTSWRRGSPRRRERTVGVVVLQRMAPRAAHVGAMEQGPLRACGLASQSASPSCARCGETSNVDEARDDRQTSWSSSRREPGLGISQSDMHVRPLDQIESADKNPLPPWPLRMSPSKSCTSSKFALQCIGPVASACAALEEIDGVAQAFAALREVPRRDRRLSPSRWQLAQLR